MRVLAIGSQALMDGFSLLGIETHSDPDREMLEKLLYGISRNKEYALIYLQQEPWHADVPILGQIRKEGGSVLISEIPPLNAPTDLSASIDKLITKVIGPSALESSHE